MRIIGRIIQVLCALCFVFGVVLIITEHDWYLFATCFLLIATFVAVERSLRGPEGMM